MQFRAIIFLIILMKESEIFLQLLKNYNEYCLICLDLGYII